MSNLQHVAVLVGLALFACGEEFTAGDAPTGGTGGGAGLGGFAEAGSTTGGDSSPDGGDDGTRNEAGGGLAGGSGSGGGASGTGGSGTSGSGGGAVIELPPVPLDGLELWFSADFGVTEVNGVVSTWKDRSGNDRNALQTALNYRPKLDAHALNGKPALVFDGNDDYLKLSPLPGDFSRGVSIFAVMQEDVDVEACNGFFEASNGPEIEDVHLGTWQNALLYEVGANTLHATNSRLVLGRPQVLSAVHQTTRAAQLRRDSLGLLEGNMPLPPVAIREQVVIGNTAYAGCAPLHGSMGELLVYRRAVSDAELVDIETYLQAKWACCHE